MSIIKRSAKQLFRALGFEVFRRERIPYGIDVTWDVERLSTDEPVRIVFDIGANVGQTAIRMAERFPGSTIYSFEPEPSAYERLQRNVDSLPQVRLYNQAAGSEEATMSMHRPRGSDLYTLDSCNGQTATEGVEVSVTTIDRVCQTEGIDQIDILKTDTEGFDVAVLEGAKELLSRRKVRFIYSECDFIPSERDNHTSFFALHDYLSELGYCLVTLYTENVVPGRGFDWGSALFCRGKTD